MPTSLRYLYSQVPSVNCKGLCSGCCGPIDASLRERAFFERETGKPFPDASEVLRSKDMQCPMLKDSRCSVYENRPMLCRLWGAVPEMPCPFGCEPTLTSEEGGRLMLETGVGS